MKSKSLRKICRRDFLRISGLATVGGLTGYPHVKAVTPTADLVLTNGKIITVDSVDTITQGVAVKRGRILELGKTEMTKKYVGRQTKVVNLMGKTVTPGLIDSHAHLPFFGLRENGWFLKLQGIRSKDEILELLAERARNTPKGNGFLHGGLRARLCLI